MVSDAWIIERMHGSAPLACPYFVGFMPKAKGEHWTSDIYKAHRFDSQDQASETITVLAHVGCTFDVVLHKPR